MNELNSTVTQEMVPSDRNQLYRLVRRLEEEDRMFQYHLDIKSQLHKTDVSCDDIICNLRQVYQADKFVIDNSAFVKKLVGEGDTVVYKKRDSAYKVFIRNKARGVVKKPSSAGAEVIFDHGFKADIDYDNLVVYGRKGRWYRKEKEFPPTLAKHLRVKKDDMVLYHGDGVEETGLSIPAGTVARVVEHNHYYLQVKFEKYPSITKTYVTQYKCVNLIVPNDIDFDKIYHECYGGELC